MLEQQNIGIVTLYRGYNYGTVLQAYALREFVCSLGYNAEIIWTNENTHSGRDIRFDKIMRMAHRMMTCSELRRDTLAAYKKSVMVPLQEATKKEFVRFGKEMLKVHGMTKSEMKAYAEDTKTKAVICGSDQIWSATSANIDPLYYLQFVPYSKRIAYAPSFGNEYVPAYNKKAIKRFLESIPNISVREQQGARIIEDLTGRRVPVLIDPTLLLDWKNWIAPDAKSDYLVAYFLNSPSRIALDSMKSTAQKLGCKIKVLPYMHSVYCAYQGIFDYSSYSPRNFVGLIGRAQCVFTDSFHGTAFSISTNRPFYTYVRDYGNAVEQSSRITSLLELFHLSDQYIVNGHKETDEIPEIDFDRVNAILNQQRKLSREFIIHALESCK